MSETNRRKTKYLAHIRENERQTIEEHLEGTAKHAEQFAAAFGGESYARTAGWYHDIGKCSDAFLTRLLEQGPKVDHASAGAYELQRQGQMIEAMCVAGHHSGLLDMGNVNVPKTGTFAGRIQKVQNKQVPTYQIPEMIKQQPIVCPYPVDILTSPFSISFFTRFFIFLFSGCRFSGHRTIYDRCSKNPNYRIIRTIGPISCLYRPAVLESKNRVKSDANQSITTMYTGR